MESELSRTMDDVDIVRGGKRYGFYLFVQDFMRLIRSGKIAIFIHVMSNPINRLSNLRVGVGVGVGYMSCHVMSNSVSPRNRHQIRLIKVR